MYGLEDHRWRLLKLKVKPLIREELLKIKLRNEEGHGVARAGDYAA